MTRGLGTGTTSSRKIAHSDPTVLVSGLLCYLDRAQPLQLLVIILAFYLLCYPVRTTNRHRGLKRLLFLIYPRLISFQNERAGGSARHRGATSAISHGWLFGRPAYSITLKIPRVPAMLIGRKHFLLRFWSSSKTKASGRECPVSRATARTIPAYNSSPNTTAQ